MWNYDEIVRCTKTGF